MSACFAADGAHCRRDERLLEGASSCLRLQQLASPRGHEEGNRDAENWFINSSPPSGSLFFFLSTTSILVLHYPHLFAIVLASSQLYHSILPLLPFCYSTTKPSPCRPARFSSASSPLASPVLLATRTSPPWTVRPPLLLMRPRLTPRPGLSRPRVTRPPRLIRSHQLLL